MKETLPHVGSSPSLANILIARDCPTLKKLIDVAALVEMGSYLDPTATRLRIA